MAREGNSSSCELLQNDIAVSCGSDSLAGRPEYFDNPEKEKEFWTKEVTLFKEKEDRHQMGERFWKFNQQDFVTNY